MSIWIRALCTSSVGHLTPATLRAAIADRLVVLATYYGEEGAEETLLRLRVDDAGDGVWLLYYRADDDRFLRIEQWSKPAAVAEEVVELREGLEDCDEDGVDDVRELLGRVVEAVGVELKMSDVEGIGWPVAMAAAACFAEHGDGLIQADEEGWMEPNGQGVDQVLDGD